MKGSYASFSIDKVKSTSYLTHSFHTPIASLALFINKRFCTLYLLGSKWASIDYLLIWVTTFHTT
jgi:hypothetical protein